MSNSLKFSSAVKYRGPNGEAWTGRGLMPKWLSVLEEQGRPRQEFEVSAAPANRLVDFKAQPGDFQTIPIELINESPFNPRKTYHEETLRELSESIKEMGILQPIRVRPMPIKSGGADEDGQDIMLDGFEVIFGHRRFRAAKMAREKTIPAMVSVLTDAESAQLQAVENLQREDLDPIEEAEGYADYIKQHGVTKQELADHISKSRTYVYNRLKLESLCDAARTFVRSGALDADLAIEIARLPTVELQESALVRSMTKTTADESGQEVVVFSSFRAGRAMIEERFKRHLDDAIFDRQVMWLVPDAVDCTSCPHRAGNIPELDATGKRADICTVPSCFDSKEQAHLAQIADATRQLGGTVIEGAEAAGMFLTYGDGDFNPHATQGKYLSLDKESYRLEQKTPRDVLGKKLNAADIVYVINPRNGKVAEVVDIETLYQHEIIERPEPRTPVVADPDAPPPPTKEERAAATAAAAREEAISEKCRAALIKTLVGPEGSISAAPLISGAITIVLRALFEHAYEVCSNNYDLTMEFDDWLSLYNPELGAEYALNCYGPLREARDLRTWNWLASLDSEVQGRLCLELVMLTEPPSRLLNDISPDLLSVTASAYGIDLAAARAEAEESVDNPPAEEEAPDTQGAGDVAEEDDEEALQARQDQEDAEVAQ